MTAWDGRPVNPERDGWHWLKGGEGPFLARYTWDAYSGTGSWREALNGEPLRLRFGGVGYAGPAVMPGENSPAHDEPTIDPRSAGGLGSDGPNDTGGLLRRLDGDADRGGSRAGSVSAAAQ